jgi:uncharacterized repeat protein (TIGR03833 family)
MDDTAHVAELLEELGDNIDDLETALEPLLRTPISTLSKNLAPLERAKLLTWLTYAIETILFSHIRLNGTEDPKSHPVMTELKRIQQYMQKVQQAENPAAGKRGNLSLNKEAAGRFIKAGLSGNEKYDKEVAERKVKEAEGARKKLQQLELASPSSAVPSIAQVVPGASVSIVLKKDQKSGDQIQGIVKEVLTKSDHPRGVKVRLQDGRVGRVQGLASEDSQNLGKDGELGKKRRADEVADEEDADSLENGDEGDAMEVDQNEDMKKTKKSKLSLEQKKKKNEKKAKKQKAGG